MEAYAHIPLRLAGTVSTSASNYTQWVNTTYRRGDKVYNGGAGDGKNYELIWEYWTSSQRPDQYPYPWREIEQAIVAYSSYETNVDESLNPAWASGTAVTEGATQYDNLTGKDYIATVDISAGNNTVRPSVAVQSDDPDLATRWVEVGPANLFAALDAEITTKTENTSSIELTLIGEGLADRVTLYGMERVQDVEVIVNAGDLVEDPTFISAGFALWQTIDATLSHADPGMVVVNGATEAVAYLLMPGFVVGESYTLSVTASGSGWKIWSSNSDGTGYQETTPATTNTTKTLTWTAGSAKQHIGITTINGHNVTVSNFSAKTAGFTQQTLTADLEYGSTGRYRRRVVFSHNAVTSPQYEITLTGGPGDTVKLGLISAGEAFTIGTTNADVRVGGEQKHAIIEDDYGSTRFLRRVRKRTMDAIVWLEDAVADGDYVDSIMAELEGQPATYNFNNAGTDIERLLIYGWASEWNTVVTGLVDNDYLSVNMKGLAE